MRANAPLHLLRAGLKGGGGRIKKRRIEVNKQMKFIVPSRGLGMHVGLGRGAGLSPGVGIKQMSGCGFGIGRWNEAIFCFIGLREREIGFFMPLPSQCLSFSLFTL